MFAYLIFGRGFSRTICLRKFGLNTIQSSCDVTAYSIRQTELSSSIILLVLLNLFNIKALENIADNKLPYHKAFKKAKNMDENGEIVKPEKPNAFKYEAFIFDAFESLDSMSILRVKREDEFAPLKNADGEDSPDTARELYKNYIESKSLYNFNFKYFSPCYTDEDFDKEHYYPVNYFGDDTEYYDTTWGPANDTLYCIGTNDKTNQIAIICHYTQWYDLELLEEPISESIVIDGKETEKCFEFKPVNSSVDEYFYTDFCGWKYISFFNFFLK